MGRRFGFASLALVGMVLAGGAPSYGLTITPTFDASITSDPNAASIEGTINSAITSYQSLFSDPINVTIQFKEMATGLGQSNTTIYNLDYSTVRNAMTADATSSDDATALLHMPTGTTNPVTGTTTIDVKTANIRALNIPGSFPSILAGGFDGIISLNTAITTPPGGPSNFSLLAVAEHEMDEVLGLGSSLSAIPFGAPAPEDLFRYDSSGNRNFTTAGDNAFFSIDGTTDLVQFNQNGSGDYGDWHTSGTPRVQDAFGTAGSTPVLGVELRALDVIGYDRTPEPGTLVCLGVFGAAAMVRRRSRV